ncbi:MAG: translocation/assembly module TamB domain-containing protein [bacterium]
MQPRRQLVVLYSALLMFVIGAGAIGGLVAATQSEGGRDWIRRQLERQFVTGMKGRVHIGRMSGSFLTDIRIDSLNITDPDDSLFIASGPARFTYDPRDILDGRIIVRSADIQHPKVIFREENDHRWNFRKVFPLEAEGPPRPRGPRTAFGSLVLFKNVQVHGLHFQLTLPWEPDDSLKGARRDSAAAYNVGQEQLEIRRVTTKGVPGFQRTWRWTDANATLNRIRFRHPDSTGRQFDIARLDVVEKIPPFDFRNMNGGLYWLGDTIWLKLPHFELPNSVARAKGTIRWGTGPVRYDIKIHSDSTGMRDIAWIYETLPRTGGGKMDLLIKNEPKDPRVIDYAITNMDLRSNGSRLRGNMTYAVGGPVLVLKDVNMQLLPANFALLETLNGQPFPYPWRGDISGTVRARGGPVHRFVVDEARLTFRDANVPGAFTRGTGRGELNILHPGDAKFRGFKIDVAQFDLRTAQFVNPDFPSIHGLVSGTATLDSIWTDVRFRDGDLTHRDGEDSPVSRFKGNGRITMAQNVIFDVSAIALPLAVSTVAKSYPSIPLRGDFSGALRVKGTASDLSVTTDLAGEAGRVQLDGAFDAVAPTVRAVANGSLSGFDLRTGFGKPALPSSFLNGRFAVDLSGDSLANLVGSARFNADRSVVDSVRVYNGLAQLRFGDGKVRIDSLRLETMAGLLTKTGQADALGLTAAARDSITFAFEVDSLGGFRRYLARGAAAGGSAEAIALADSLEGTARVEGALVGSLDRLDLQLRADGRDLRVGATTARHVVASAALRDVLKQPLGPLTIRLDTLRASELSFVRVSANVALLPDRRASGTIAGEMPHGARARASLSGTRNGDTTDVRLDSLSVVTAADAWSLDRGAAARLVGTSLSFDTLALTGATGGHFLARGAVPDQGPLAVSLRADRIPLADFGELLQLETALKGAASLQAELTGTRSEPVMRLTAQAEDAQVAGLRLDHVQAQGTYAAQRLTTSLEYTRLGIPALRVTGKLPMDLALRPGVVRFLEDPISVQVRTDTVGLVLLESFSRAITGARGGMAVNLDVSGTWKHPRLLGEMSVRDGALTLAPMGRASLTGIEADIRFLGDSVAVRKLSARAGPTRGAQASITGAMKISDIENPVFNLGLTARNFNVLNRVGFADLDVSGSLALTGSLDRAVLSGDSLTVDRGVLNVSNLFQKKLIALDDNEIAGIIDTSAFADRRLFAQSSGRFVDNLTMNGLQVTMGRDVWLRSEEANINLGGQLNITRSRLQRGTVNANVGSQLALVGTLQTVRGSYRLSVGPGVQRAFDVETGDVRFFGDVDLNPTLSINAMHTVRQYSTQSARPDVRVRVHIGGTLSSPTAELSSPDSLRVTNGDLISYLVTGGPSDEIGGRNGDIGSTAARVFVSSFGTFLGGKATGTLCDDAQISTAGLDAYQGKIADVGAGLLSGTRFNCAKQVGVNTFVRLDAGLCQVGQLLAPGSSSAEAPTFADALGVKVDYRVRSNLTFSFGIEPPTSAVLCSRDANARGFAPTPRQFGLDLFRLWRF